MDKTFSGRSVLITGAGRGMGRQMALDFARAGARVAVNYSAAEADATEVVELIRSSGGEAVLCKADVSSAKEVSVMVDDVMTTFGRIDVLINNAGINIDKPLLDLSEEDWDRVLDVNLKGPFLCSQAVGRHMVAAGKGSIVNISAVTGTQARKNAANYCSSKAGLNMLTMCLALELGPQVNVNALGLGFVESPIVKDLYTEDQMAAVREETPLERMSSYEEASAFVMMLASDTAGFVTGQTIIFDGGRVMR